MDRTEPRPASEPAAASTNSEQPQLRLVGTRRPPADEWPDHDTRDDQVEAVRDILIRSGVAADRIRVFNSGELAEQIAERALMIGARDGRAAGDALRCWQEAKALVVAEIEQGYGRRVRGTEGELRS